MGKSHALLIIFIVLVVVNTFVMVGLAFGDGESDEDEDDIIVFGYELEELLSFVNGILALVLFLITFIAYRRNKNKRLFYVSIAFFLFAVRSFLVSSELFIEELAFVDPVSVGLDFIILLTFFYGLLRK